MCLLGTLFRAPIHYIERELLTRLYKLGEKLPETHEPIHITGKNKSAVLVAGEDWQSIEETLYLLFVPGMRESITKGMNEPFEKSSKKIGW